MKLIYNDVEIYLNIKKCIVKDNMGDKIDSLIIHFSDIKNECRKWNFRKGDKIEVIYKEFSSGEMYVDSIELDKGVFILKALSIRKKTKTKKIRCWENVKFLDIANDIAMEEGVKLKTYGIEDFRYLRVDQTMKNNIEFLNYRCFLEGYNLKISNKTLIIISEKFLDQQETIDEIDKTDFLNQYNFKNCANKIYGGCKIKFFSDKLITGIYEADSENEILVFNDIPVESIQEANRFCKNITNYFNKYEVTGKFNIKNMNIVAGNTLKINLGIFSGIYVVESVLKDMINSTNNVVVRRLKNE